MRLIDFLKSKPLYYDKIDLDRMPRAYAKIEKYLEKGRFIHVIGTNGKGSTGRMLAELLRSRGLKVGHYSSPHILRFNERIWIEGREISDSDLQKAHEKLLKWLSVSEAESLSYFEYTTLLAFVAFEGLDIVVLEAGLGGEFDATSVIQRQMSVVTPIGLDHQAFLGETIEEIASTKVRSIAKYAVMAPQPYPEAISTAYKIAAEKGSELFFAEDLIEEEVKLKVEAIARSKKWPPFFSQNAMTALAAAALFLEDMPDPSILENTTIPGRFERIAHNVILDVGHNPLGAQAVVDALDLYRPILVYNALADKNIDEILEIMAPHVSRLELIEIDDARTMDPQKIADAAKRVGLETAEFKGVNESENYLVFGSFAVAEAFLKYV